jgi:hypothetical protein
MENRYQDNLSPEPTVQGAHEYYKTPNFATNFNQIYPTPPSDNDENGSPSLHRNVNYYTTPKLSDNYYYYGLNPVEKNYASARQAGITNNSNQSFDDSSQADKLNVENESLHKGASSRSKRRSRTTFSQDQVKFNFKVRL